MSVPYTGTHAEILNALAGHLAAGAAVQGFLGVAGELDPVAAARARIVEIDGDILETAHILLSAPRLRVARTPGGAYRGTATCGIILCAPVTSGDTVAEDHRRALGWLSPIFAWCLALRQPLVRDADDEEPVAMDPSDGLAGWLCAGINLTVEVLP